MELNGDLLNGMVLQLTTPQLEFYGLNDINLNNGSIVVSDQIDSDGDFIKKTLII